MSDTKNTGGPAFPSPEHVEFHEDLGSGKPGYREYMASSGMTMRQYAAITLKVPDSGDEWLDQMIRQSLRDEMAAKAIQGMMSTSIKVASPVEKNIALAAYRMADSMLKAR